MSINQCQSINGNQWMSINQCQSINVNQSMSINQCQPINVNQSMSIRQCQSINVNQSMSINQCQSINVNQSMSINVNQSMNQPTNQPINQIIWNRVLYFFVLRNRIWPGKKHWSVNHMHLFNSTTVERLWAIYVISLLLVHKYQHHSVGITVLWFSDILKMPTSWIQALHHLNTDKAVAIGFNLMLTVNICTVAKPSTCYN